MTHRSAPSPPLAVGIVSRGIGVPPGVQYLSQNDLLLRRFFRHQLQALRRESKEQKATKTNFSTRVDSIVSHASGADGIDVRWTAFRPRPLRDGDADHFGDIGIPTAHDGRYLSAGTKHIRVL